MKMRISYLIACMFMALACESARVEPAVRYGEISVGLSGLSADVSTKASDTYNISLINAEDAGQNRTAVLAEGVQESFVVRYGTYGLYAEDCTEKEAEEGNGRKRIAGKVEGIELSDAAPFHDINIDCSVSNAMVIVLFEDTVQEGGENLFRDLKVNLQSEEGRSLDILQDRVNTDIVTWFNPTETFTYTVSGIYIENGRDITRSFSRELNAKDCIRITVRLVVPSGGLLPELSFDVDIISIESSTGTFNPYL